MKSHHIFHMESEAWEEETSKNRAEVFILQPVAPIWPSACLYEQSFIRAQWWLLAFVSSVIVLELLGYRQVAAAETTGLARPTEFTTWISVGTTLQTPVKKPGLSPSSDIHQCTI